MRRGWPASRLLFVCLAFLWGSDRLSQAEDSPAPAVPPAPAAPAATPAPAPAAAPAPPAATAASSIQFNRDVRPILAENCFRCHGPDSASRKADLRLDRRENAVEHKAIVPGKPDESSLVERILSTDPDEVMPPPDTHKELKPAEKELLKAWIVAGAEYQPHWSLIAPIRPTPPAVKNEAWVRTPIDRFILAKLEEHGLSPAPRLTATRWPGG